MSGPYNPHGGQPYNQPQGYNPYPAQGYGQQQPQQPPYYPSQDGGYQDQGFAPPARTNSFGPPQHGGFQMGIQGQQYGNYDASNPQGNAGYYGTPGPQHGSYDNAYSQNQAYQASMAPGQHQQQPPYNANAPPTPQSLPDQYPPQSSDPNAPNYDPSAPPMGEGERGLLGALGGGVGGHLLGKKAGHGFLGTVGGGILGSLAEDFMKDKNKKSHHHSHHSHHSSHGGGGSSWGGSRH